MRSALASCSIQHCRRRKFACAWLFVSSLVAFSCLPATTQAQWAVSWHTDEMTDVRQAVFRLAAATLTRNVIGASDRTMLVFRCSKGSLDDAYVVLNAFTPETKVTL